jgi:hypothetical protein
VNNPRFVKRPVVVEAWQIPTPYALPGDAPEWVIKNAQEAVIGEGPLMVTSPAPGGLTKAAYAGHWIVKAPTGCIYPIDPETFERNYRPEVRDVEAIAKELDEVLEGLDEAQLKAFESYAKKAMAIIAMAAVAMGLKNAHKLPAVYGPVVEIALFGLRDTLETLNAMGLVRPQ